MSDWSRRDILLGTTGAAAALAGCQFTDADGSPPRRGQGADSEWATHDSRDQVVDDYEYERVRDSGATALFTHEGTEFEPDSTSYDHVATAEDLEDIAFADVEAGERLQSFAETIDMETESLFLYWRQIGTCYDLELASVTVEDDSARASFCRASKPADVPCAGDGEVTVGYAIRLPVAGDDFSGQGAGYGLSCTAQRRPEPFVSNVTVADRGGDQ